MTNESKTRIIHDPTSLQPSEEMIRKTLDALKSAPENLWEEFKSVEVNVGDLQNETGKKVDSKMREVNPGTNGFQIAHLRMKLRSIARKEAGITDK